uniref:Uncharacterized protein n=1 Tax=Spumella elongata TaxID=89044 RepID=A0A7S3M017_9STRA|mmetsp:Transcript_17279/g.30139  ORF Transcript_17279/g.30139 Transcript_17279/m.30139 type:complete len:145 (-) Transcript_17279:2-436(-)
MGRGAYINTWREETHTDPMLSDVVARKLSMVPSSGDFYDDDSSDIALSSLHSSEQSNVSVYTTSKQQAPGPNEDQEQKQEQEEQITSMLPSSLESSEEASLSEYSDSSDSTNSSSSASYSSDDLSDGSDNYSFPSSLTSGADNC